jgi:photosystem II stability/assembly factor-like uncharacterized protein
VTNRRSTPVRSRVPVPPKRWPLVGIGAVALLLLLVAGALLLANRSSGPAAAGGLAPIATLNAPDYHSLSVSPQDADRVWFGAHNGIQESADGGHTWQPLPGVSGDAMNIARPLADPARIYMAGHEIFQRSTDGGRTWQAMRTNLPDMDMHGFAADPADAQHLFTFVVANGLFESSDGGARWLALPAPPADPAGAIAVVTGRPLTLYAATTAGVMRSPDGGKSWQPATAGLTEGNSSVRALLAVPGQPQELYAGTIDGLYHTKDGGISWQPAGLAGLRIAAIAASQSGPLRLYVVTAEGAVFRLEGPTLMR